MAGTGGGGKTVPLGHQEPISRDAQRGVMVEPSPVAALEVPEPEFLLEFFIVPFDNPPMFGDLDESFERGVGRQCREPVLSGFLLAWRPLDQQPLFGVRFRLPVIAMRRADPKGSKARS